MRICSVAFFPFESSKAFKTSLKPKSPIFRDTLYVGVSFWFDPPVSLTPRTQYWGYLDNTIIDGSRHIHLYPPQHTSNRQPVIFISTRHPALRIVIPDWRLSWGGTWPGQGVLCSTLLNTDGSTRYAAIELVLQGQKYQLATTTRPRLF